MNKEKYREQLSHLVKIYKESMKRKTSNSVSANLNSIVSYTSRRALKNLFAIKAYYFLTERSKAREAKKNNIV